MIGLMKLLPMVAFLGGGYATNDKMKAKIDKILNYTKVVSIQYEINNISKMIYLDALDGRHPKPQQLANYLRKNMKVKIGQKRDTSKDFWGRAYRIDYFEREKKFVVRSAGPDRRFQTEDDITGGYYY